ncbi:MAG: TspO/MBR family protein [Steroidobacteraceae bacterium]
MTDFAAVRRRAWWYAALGALAVAILGGLATEIGPWYRALAKPSWNPPDWLFGPAWTLIYALTALAGVEAWQAARERPQRRMLALLFIINGCLNVLWSLLFFRLRRPDWALFEVGALWLSIVSLLYYCGRLHRRSVALLLPYLLWVSFAAVLNASVVSLNAPFGAAAQ